MIVHENSGETDPLAYTTLGINVKVEADGSEKTDAIGIFGTGFKYAVAIALRHGCKVILQSGASSYEFHLREHEVRGKKFQFVYLDNERLAFTSDLGKNWKLWMAYREFHCNALDENGDTFECHQMPTPEVGMTRIIVIGAPYEQVWQEHHTYFLKPNLVTEVQGVEVHRGQSREIYYFGNLVSQLERPSIFTYNIVERVDLTEDRTLRYAWQAERQIAYALLKSDNRDYIETCAYCERAAFAETRISLEGWNPNETFMEVMAELTKKRRLFLPLNMWEAYKTHAPKELLIPPEVDLDEVQFQQFQRAQSFCIRHGFDLREFEIKFTDSLGEGALGAVIDKRIWINLAVFEQGTKMLAGTLIEEYIHLNYILADVSRGFQNFCINKIVSLCEKIDGEPI